MANGERKGTAEFRAVAAGAAFAGMLLGILGPTMLFADRLTRQEEREKNSLEMVTELKTDVRSLRDAVATLQQELHSARKRS